MEIKKYTKKLLERGTIIGLVIAFFAAYFLFPNFYESSLYPVPAGVASWISLDPSWHLILNKANIDGLQWGRDLTFTYGPLGYLATRVGWGMSKYSFLLFDLFVSFNFICIFYHVYRNSRLKIGAALVILSVAICLPAHFGSGNSLVLLAFLIFWILRSFGNTKPFFYAMQISLILLLFFIKFNTGLITFIFFLIALVLNIFVLKEKRILLAIYSLLPFIFVWVLSRVLNVDLATYIPGGMNMVSGYNDIMYLDQDFTPEFRFSLFLVFVVLCVSIRNLISGKENLKKNLLISFLLFSSVYLLYKQSFVRNDIQHVLDFYRFILLFIACSFGFYSLKEDKLVSFLSGLVMVVAIFFISQHDKNFIKIENRLKKSDYVSGFTNFTKTSGYHLDPPGFKIPDRITSRIAKHTVDIYPWNVHLLIENRLNYRGRPVPQSYTAYTSYLENLNFEFYNSVKAPEYVLYEFDGIDNRYPLFDETKLNLALLTNYICADTFYQSGTLVLVLEKTGKKIPRFEKTGEHVAGIYDKLVPAAGEYYEVNISNSFKGKCRSFLEHGPKLDLLIKTKDGSLREYKTSKELLKTGIFSNRLFASTLDFKNAMSKDSLDSRNEIEYYAFRTADSSLFNKEIKITTYKIIRD